MRIPGTPFGWLRGLLSVGGLGALVGVGGGALVSGAELTPVHLTALVSGGLALGTAAAAGRLGAGVTALLAGLSAFGAALAIGWSYDAVSSPYVDLVRPWGMDWDPYPLTRPTLGALLLAGLVPAALGAASRRARVALRVLGGTVCAALLAYWGVPRWYEMDLVAREGVVPDMPSYLPRPGWVGAGDTPVVIGGKLVRLHWTQYAYRAPPAKALWYVAHRELALAGIAHGMHWTLTEAKAASGALAPAAAARQAAVRGVLWQVQRGASTAWLYAQAAAAVLWGWLLVRLAWGRAQRDGEARAVRMALRVLVLGGPLVNLLLLAGTVLAGLPDAGAAAGRVLVESAGLLGCGVVLELAGRHAVSTEGRA